MQLVVQVVNVLLFLYTEGMLLFYMFYFSAVLIQVKTVILQVFV